MPSMDKGAGLRMTNPNARSYLAVDDDHSIAADFVWAHWASYWARPEINAWLRRQFQPIARFGALEVGAPPLI